VEGGGWRVEGGGWRVKILSGLGLGLGLRSGVGRFRVGVRCVGVCVTYLVNE
jgi:hypothetical protein